MDLALLSEPQSFFALPAVYESWCRRLSEGTSSKVIMITRDGMLCGVFPIMIGRVWRGPRLGVRYDYAAADRRYLTRRSIKLIPVRQLSPVLSLPGTMLGSGLTCRPGFRSFVMNAIVERICELGGWDLAALPAYQGDEIDSWVNALSKHGLHSVLQRVDRSCYYLSTVVPFESLVAKQRKKFRQNMRRASRAAQEAGIETKVIAEDLPRILSEMNSLAALSWKQPGRKDQDVHLPYAGAQRAFFEDLLANPRLGAKPLAALAICDGRPIAVMLATTHGKTLTTLLTFRDASTEDTSVGALLIGTLVDWANQHGLTSVDFNSGHPAVRHYSDRVLTIQNVLAFAPTTRGHMLQWLSTRFGRRA